MPVHAGALVHVWMLLDSEAERRAPACRHVQVHWHVSGRSWISGLTQCFLVGTWAQIITFGCFLRFGGAKRALADYL